MSMEFEMSPTGKLLRKKNTFRTMNSIPPVLEFTSNARRPDPEQIYPPFPRILSALCTFFLCGL